jgi:ABC-type uncharacterized transport system auxiliary subunit
MTCIGLFLATGCTSPTPAPNEYRLYTNTEAVQAEKTKCMEKTLKVDQALSDKLFLSLKMYYVKGQYSQYAYARSRWIQSPNDAVTKAITEYLRAMHLFKSVQNAESQTKNDFRLEINIEDFMQYFDANEENSFVNVVLTCNLINNTTHKIVTTKTFHAKVKAKSNDAQGGVIALNYALDTILKECGLWLQGVCFDK